VRHIGRKAKTGGGVGGGGGINLCPDFVFVKLMVSTWTSRMINWVLPTGCSCKKKSVPAVCIHVIFLSSSSRPLARRTSLLPLCNVRSFRRYTTVPAALPRWRVYRPISHYIILYNNSYIIKYLLKKSKRENGKSSPSPILLLLLLLRDDSTHKSNYKYLAWHTRQITNHGLFMISS